MSANILKKKPLKNLHQLRLISIGDAILWLAEAQGWFGVALISRYLAVFECIVVEAVNFLFLYRACAIFDEI